MTGHKNQQNEHTPEPILYFHSVSINPASAIVFESPENIFLRF